MLSRGQTQKRKLKAEINKELIYLMLLTHRACLFSLKKIIFFFTEKTSRKLSVITKLERNLCKQQIAGLVWSEPCQPYNPVTRAGSLSTAKTELNKFEGKSLMDG